MRNLFIQMIFFFVAVAGTGALWKQGQRTSATEQQQTEELSVGKQTCHFERDEEMNNILKTAKT